MAGKKELTGDAKSVTALTGRAERRVSTAPSSESDYPRFAAERVVDTDHEPLNDGDGHLLRRLLLPIISLPLYLILFRRWVYQGNI